MATRGAEAEQFIQPDETGDLGGPREGPEAGEQNVAISPAETAGNNGIIVLQGIENGKRLFGKLFQQGLAAGDDLVFIRGGRQEVEGHVEAITQDQDDKGPYYKVQIDGDLYRLDKSFDFLTEDTGPVDPQGAAHNPGARRATGPGAARHEKTSSNSFTSPPAGSPPGGPPPGFGTSQEKFGGQGYGPHQAMNKVRFGDQPPTWEPQLSNYEREQVAKLVTTWSTAMEEERRQELVERTLTQGKRRFGFWGSIFMSGYAEMEVYKEDKFHLEDKDLKMLERHAKAVITNNAATLVRDQLLTDSGHDAYRMLQQIGLDTDANGNFVNIRGNGGFELFGRSMFRALARTNRSGGIFGVTSVLSGLMNLGGAGVGGVIGGTLLGAGIGAGLGFLRGTTEANISVRSTDSWVEEIQSDLNKGSRENIQMAAFKVENLINGAGSMELLPWASKFGLLRLVELGQEAKKRLALIDMAEREFDTMQNVFAEQGRRLMDDDERQEAISKIYEVFARQVGQSEFSMLLDYGEAYSYALDRVIGRVAVGDLLRAAPAGNAAEAWQAGSLARQRFERGSIGGAGNARDNMERAWNRSVDRREELANRVILGATMNGLWQGSLQGLAGGLVGTAVGTGLGAIGRAAWDTAPGWVVLGGILTEGGIVTAGAFGGNRIDRFIRGLEIEASRRRLEASKTWAPNLGTTKYASPDSYGRMAETWKSYDTDPGKLPDRNWLRYLKENEAQERILTLQQEVATITEQIPQMRLQRTETHKRANKARKAILNLNQGLFAAIDRFGESMRTVLEIPEDDQEGRRKKLADIIMSEAQTKAYEPEGVLHGNDKEFVAWANRSANEYLKLWTKYQEALDEVKIWDTKIKKEEKDLKEKKKELSAEKKRMADGRKQIHEGKIATTVLITREAREHGTGLGAESGYTPIFHQDIADIGKWGNVEGTNVYGRAMRALSQEAARWAEHQGRKLAQEAFAVPAPTPTDPNHTEMARGNDNAVFVFFSSSTGASKHTSDIIAGQFQEASQAAGGAAHIFNFAAAGRDFNKISERAEAADMTRQLFITNVDDEPILGPQIWDTAEMQSALAEHSNDKISLVRDWLDNPELQDRLGIRPEELSWRFKEWLADKEKELHDLFPGRRIVMHCVSQAWEIDTFLLGLMGAELERSAANDIGGRMIGLGETARIDIAAPRTTPAGREIPLDYGEIRYRGQARVIERTHRANEYGQMYKIGTKYRGGQHNTEIRAENDRRFGPGYERSAGENDEMINEIASLTGWTDKNTLWEVNNYSSDRQMLDGARINGERVNNLTLQQLFDASNIPGRVRFEARIPQNRDRR